MNKKDFIISTIVPVYNVEKYLKVALDSIVKQTIGFKKNIQLILVNDDSPDNCEDICLSYQAKYPDNIVYIKQKNAGVSAARNNGLKHATGKYVNFFDSDDKWDLDAYEKAVKFLEKNNDFDLVVLRTKYFDAINNYHILDEKFKHNLTYVDIFEDYYYIQSTVTPVIFRRNILKNKAFNTNAKYAEDTCFLNEVLIETKKYGLIDSANYYYRKRLDKSSVTQIKNKGVAYTDSLKYACASIFNLAKKRYKEIPKYFQYSIMYELQWRLKYGIEVNLPESNKISYIKDVKDLLKQIDDDIILGQKNIGIYYKYIALKMKYDGNLNLSIENDYIFINNKSFCKIKSINNVIELLKITNNKLHIDGRIALLSDDFELYYSTTKDDKYKKIDLYSRSKKTVKFSDENAIERKGYSLDIPLKNNMQVKFYFKFSGQYYLLKNLFIAHSRINNEKGHYYTQSGYMVTRSINSIKIKKIKSKLTIFKKEVKYLLYLFLKNFNRKKKNNKKIFRTIKLRLLYFVSKPFMPKNIWLFCDREFMGRDNAEALYKYTLKQNNKQNNYYFVINKTCDDYKRIKKYGKVLAYHTLKYELFFLNAKYLISSHADGYINNAFGSEKEFLVDLYKFKYIYLTHGILLHDSSSWLNRINKDFTLNVVTSPLERKSILENEYYLNKNDLLETGMPRHDNLYIKHKEKNQILFMPSWRSTLCGPAIPGTQFREYNPNFTESEYFKFYDRLFNDKQLLSKLKDKDLKIKFCIHPSFRNQYNDFKGNDYVEIAIDVDSQYEALVSKMLVTDYSSCACDFAYLKKPVVYANFDLDHIYDIHYYNKGYFDYDKNGFGPNCKSYDKTLNEIIKCIDSDFKMEKKYEERCNKFFLYIDSNNCKRVYETINKFDKKNLD